MFTDIKECFVAKNYKLTVYSRVLIEKLMVTKPVRTFLIFFGT